MIKVFTLLAALAQGAGTIPHSEQLCGDPGADLRFACDGKGGERIAICKGHEGSTTSLDIRVEFPRSDLDATLQVGVGGTEMPLRFNHYSRFQTEYLEFAAQADGTEYRVFRHYLGEFGEPNPVYGMVIRSLDDGAETLIECMGDVVDQLSTLPPFLECDSDNALGCGIFEQGEPAKD